MVDLIVPTGEGPLLELAAMVVLLLSIALGVAAVYSWRLDAHSPAPRS